MAVPTGLVDLFRADTNANVGTTSLDSSGNYSFSTGSFSNTSIGLYTKYRGDANNAPSQSPTVSEIPEPSQAPTTTTLTIAPNPTGTGQTQTIGGTVSN